jgi:hypothetical protein
MPLRLAEDGRFLMAGRREAPLRVVASNGGTRAAAPQQQDQEALVAFVRLLAHLAVDEIERKTRDAQ